MEQINYIEAKSILSKLSKPDPWFGISWNMNLYRGCGHGCIYCDTRSTCYGIGDISRISVKRNAIELLRRELASKKTKGTIGTGSMNDPFMPLERSEGITRRALEVIADKRFPVHVITKGDLVIRDADLLREISGQYAAVSFTITTADDALARRLEPGASQPSARFAAMEHLASKGIYTGVTMMPILPFVNDTPQNISDILKRAKDAGASYVIPMFGMTLRDGSREYYYRKLDEGFPGVRKQYEAAFGDSYQCNSQNYRLLADTFNSESSRLGLKSKMDFYEPQQDTQTTLF